jgi:hypothetical protein
MLGAPAMGLSQVLSPCASLPTTPSPHSQHHCRGLIFFIGLVVAKIVRRLVEGSLLAANADGWLRKTGLVETAGTTAAAPAGSPATLSGRASITRSVGMIVFFLIMIPVTIAALDALRIEAISGPRRRCCRPFSTPFPMYSGR